METEKKLSWWQYQKGEKWFLLAFLFIAMGVIGVVFADGGFVWGALFAAGALLLGVYGGIFKWLEYKNGRTS